MRKIFLTFIILFLILSIENGFCQGEFPKPSGYVNDFAGVIPAEYKGKMEIIARELEQKTGVEIAVVTVKTTGDMDYNEYANRLYSAWGIGKKGVDEGVLILNAVEDRKVRIEVGYGLEGILPDGICGEIRDYYLVPFLKKGRYGEGLLNGMLAAVSVIAADKGVTISGETPRRVSSGSRAKKGAGGIGSFLTLMFFLFLLSGRGRRRGGSLLPLILLGGMMGSGRSSWGQSGGFGGFSGGFGGFGGGMSGGGGAGGGY